MATTTPANKDAANSLIGATPRGTDDAIEPTAATGRTIGKLVTHDTTW